MHENKQANEKVEKNLHQISQIGKRSLRGCKVFSHANVLKFSKKVDIFSENAKNSSSFYSYTWSP